MFDNDGWFRATASMIAKVLGTADAFAFLSWWHGDFPDYWLWQLWALCAIGAVAVILFAMWGLIMVWAALKTAAIQAAAASS